MFVRLREQRSLVLGKLTDWQLHTIPRNQGIVVVSYGRKYENWVRRNNVILKDRTSRVQLIPTCEWLYDNLRADAFFFLWVLGIGTVPVSYSPSPAHILLTKNLGLIMELSLDGKNTSLLSLISS